MSRNTFEVYAVKYATRDGKRRENFHGVDPHDAPVTMDYYVWALVSPELTVVVDTGFTPEVAKKRGRIHLRCPSQALASRFDQHFLDGVTTGRTGNLPRSGTRLPGGDFSL